MKLSDDFAPSVGQGRRLAAEARFKDLNLYRKLQAKREFVRGHSAGGGFGINYFRSIDFQTMGSAAQ